MPELPEVETVRCGLIPHLQGHRIAWVEQRRSHLRFPLPKNLPQRLQGRCITKLTRRGKYLLLHLDDAMILVIHLGMSGRFMITMPPAPDPEIFLNPPVSAHPNPGNRERHDHVLLHLENGTCVRFNDPRRFGSLLLIAEVEFSSHPRLGLLGPEPLEADLTGAKLAASLCGRRTTIKSALLDQHLLAGLGNIYACEALYHAGLAPDRRASTIDEAEATKLLEAIRGVLIAAIEAGGSSLRDYVQADGNLGYFQKQFAVYGREGEPCPDCTCNHAIRRIVQGGRSTFYCAHRQS